MTSMVSAFNRMKDSACDRMVRAWAISSGRRFMKRDPFAAQSDILSGLIAKGRATRFGKDHGFSALSGKP